MAASLPGGLLERMMNLTESLLAALGDKNGPTTYADVSSHRNYQEFSENAMQLEGVSCHSGVQATARLFTSLAAVDTSSNHVLRIKRATDGPSSADGAEQIKSRSREAKMRAVSSSMLDKVDKRRQVTMY